MESLFVFVMGILVGVIVTAKNVGNFIRDLDDQRKGSFGFIVLGAVLCLTTWAMGWAGFVCVITVFVLYQFMSEGLAPAIQKFFGSIKWPKKKVEKPDFTTVPANVPNPSSSVIDGPIPPTIVIVDQWEEDGGSIKQEPF